MKLNESVGSQGAHVPEIFGRREGWNSALASSALASVGSFVSGSSGLA